MTTDATPETALAVSAPKSIDEVFKPASQSVKMTRLAAFTPANLTEAIALAKLMAKSALVPKEYQGKADNILIGMQFAAELGVPLLTALQNISIINGRACVWGDLLLGLVQTHPQYEWHKEWINGDGDNRVAICQMKRKNSEIHQQTFSVADAKKANLWGKSGPWQTNPNRMLQMRARGFCARDKFADALRGLIIAEEAMDIPVETGPQRQEREAAILDITTTLTPSSEPNRGHENTGLHKPPKPDQPPAKADPIMCGECRKIDSHDPTCSQFDKAAQQDAQTAQFVKVVCVILGVNMREKKDKSKAPYLVLDIVDSTQKEGKLYVWHKSMFDYFIDAAGHSIAVKKSMICEVSKNEKGTSTYANLEHILEIAGVAFVGDKPAEAGEMPTEEENEAPEESESAEDTSEGLPGIFDKK